MARLGYSTACTVANTSRDGTGTLYRVFEVAAANEYISEITCYSLGTNAATTGALLGKGPAGTYFMLGEADLAATTLGTYAATDTVTFTIAKWFPKDYEVYALVNATQAAGRQFVACSDASYQRYAFSYEQL